MKSKLKLVTAGILLLALVAFVWQCTSWFSSTTLRLTYYIEDDIYSVENDVDKAEIDLTEHKDWQEHHDDVKGINRVLFAFWVKNHGDVEATAQFFISEGCDLSTEGEVRNGATLVLDGISVPANDSIYVTAKESYRYLRHFDELEKRLIEGQFCLYCIAENAPFDIEVPDSAALVIDFTYAVDWEF